VVVAAKLDAPLALVENGRVELLEPVSFAKDSATLLSESEPILSAARAVLRAHPEISRVVVAGFSDDHGSRKHNLDLTSRRAAAVRSWLIHHDIKSSRVAFVGCGIVNPIASNEMEEGRARNRRVELKIGGGTGAACKP